jgi:hypothetical protein
MELTEESGAWRPTKFGQSRLAFEVAELRSKLANVPDAPPLKPLSLVFVPSANLYLLKRTRATGVVQYSPVRNVGTLVQGNLYSVAQLAAALKKVPTSKPLSLDVIKGLQLKLKTP